MRNLEDKVVLITGASRGLGVDIAREFAARGAKLALAARSQADLERVRDDLLAGDCKQAIAVPADVSDLDSLRALVERVTAELGPIDGDDTANGSPMASFSPVKKPGSDGTKVLRGAWSRRMVVTWFNAEGTLEQAIVDKDGDVRHLSKPRYEAGNGLRGQLVGSP